MWIVFIDFLDEKYIHISDPNKMCTFYLQEIRPTLNELGISTPAEMGYDKPELHLESAHTL